MTAARDSSLGTLLDLNGEVMVIGEGPYWTKFIVKRVPASDARPHGLNYSLTLHDGNGERVLGFDNAHSVRKGSGPAARKSTAHDHRHHLKAVRHYEYVDAGTLLQDFWEAVFVFLEKRGLKHENAESWDRHFRAISESYDCYSNRRAKGSTR